MSMDRIVHHVWERAQRQRPHTPGNALYSAVLRFLRFIVKTEFEQIITTCVYDGAMTLYDATVYDCEPER